MSQCCQFKPLLVDAKSGKVDMIVHKSKSASDLYNGLRDAFQMKYNAHGHKIVKVHTDAEFVYKALKKSFGAIGIESVMSPPNQHAQRVERYKQTVDGRKRAVLSGLSYHLPLHLEVYVDVKVTCSMNKLPNSKSYPNTPGQLVEGKRAVYHKTLPFLPFGATCMVEQYELKGRSIALKNGVSYSGTPVAELGVCLGEDPLHPGSYIFIVENGSIMPRRVVNRVHVHPWDWKRKYTPVAELIVPRVSRFNKNVQSGMTVDPSSTFPTLVQLQSRSKNGDDIGSSLQLQKDYLVPTGGSFVLDNLNGSPSNKIQDVVPKLLPVVQLESTDGHVVTPQLVQDPPSVAQLSSDANSITGATENLDTSAKSFDVVERLVLPEVRRSGRVRKLNVPGSSTSNMASVSLPIFGSPIADEQLDQR